MHTKTIAFGALFGFVLSRIGITDYDVVTGMFRLSDLHLIGAIATSIAVAGSTVWLLRRRRATSHSGEPMNLAGKPMVRGLVPGALIFGVGWALSGTCPGTALAQIGEGRVLGLATFVGILVGAYAAGRLTAARSAPERQLYVAVSKNAGNVATPWYQSSSRESSSTRPAAVSRASTPIAH